ncbi:MAG: fumarylacetoacetate hydrolase family protein [Alphaproteobacteria bacterium]
MPTSSTPSTPSYVIPEPSRPTLPVAGGGLFPIRRVWCVARNYAAHVRELGGDPDRDPPTFFAKPADAVVPRGGPIPYPPATADFHHEVELVVAIGNGGVAIAADTALDHVLGYGVGIDFTRRDLQAAARAAGLPWDMAKGFDFSAPCSELIRASDIGHPSAGPIRLSVNDRIRQDGDLNQMIWPVADVIAALSRLVTLAPGDLIFTGTPAGVGPVVPGDRLDCAIAGVATMTVTIRN